MSRRPLQLSRLLMWASFVLAGVGAWQCLGSSEPVRQGVNVNPAPSVEMVPLEPWDAADGGRP